MPRKRAAFDGRRQGAAVREHDACPHAREWFRHARHRALAQRLVAVDAAAARARRRETRQEARGGTGVTGVDVELGQDRVREDDGAAVRHRLDEASHRAQRLHGGAHVGGIRDAVDGLAAARGGTEDQRAVRNRLIAGNLEDAVEPACFFDRQLHAATGMRGLRLAPGEKAHAGNASADTASSRRAAGAPWPSRRRGFSSSSR